MSAPKAKQKKKTSSQTEQEIIEATIKKLLDLLQIEGTFELSVSEEAIDVILATNDSGMVIGYHGDGLESLQLILSLCISRQIGRFIRVSVEIGDYKKNRIDWLENITIQTKERVLQENKEISLPSLKSWERRIVHVLLQNDDQVTSESIGEGKDRTLIIKPKSL